MPTYEKIQSYVKHKHNISIKTCWIAHMKEVCGIPLRNAHNRKGANKREYECPDNKKIYIKEAFEHFNMI